jgi:DnaJ-class molecular chaperone
MAELDYYKILGVHSTSSVSQIRQRYQQLAKQHHPDHQGDERAMVIINNAYEVLSNSTKRIEYDNLRRLIKKRQTATSNSPQKTQTNWSKTNYKAKASNKDMIAVAVFIVLLIVTMLGIH